MQRSINQNPGNFEGQGQPPYQPQQQPGYGPTPGPQQMMPPAPMMGPSMPMKTKTEGSLLVMNMGVWLAAIAMLIFTVAGLIMYSAASSADVGTAAGMVGTICGSMVLLLLGMFLMLIGSILLLVNRHEFGPKHAGKAMLSFICYILAIVMVVLMIMLPFLMISGSMYATSQEAFDVYRGVVTIIAVIGFLFNVFLLLSIVFSCEALIAPERKGILWIGFIIGIIASLAGVVLVLMVFSGDVADMTVDDIQTTQNVQFLSWGLSVIGLFILAIVQLTAYGRIKRGEISPMMPQPGYPPQQPGYPPQQPYYPPQQPPQQPPQ